MRRAPKTGYDTVVSLLGDGNGIQLSDSAGGGGLLLRLCFCMKATFPNKRHGDERRDA